MKKCVSLFIILFLHPWLPTNGQKVLQMADCLEFTESLVCYHCDSKTDEYCGEPFKFSRYFTGPSEVTTVECQGCCVKIVHPKNNGTRRIQRSCTDNLANLNFSLDANCDSYGEGDRGICICQKGLCNDAPASFPTFSFVFAMAFIFHCFVRN